MGRVEVQPRRLVQQRGREGDQVVYERLGRQRVVDRQHRAGEACRPVGVADDGVDFCEELVRLLPDASDVLVPLRVDQVCDDHHRPAGIDREGVEQPAGRLDARDAPGAPGLSQSRHWMTSRMSQVSRQITGFGSAVSWATTVAVGGITRAAHRRTR